MEGMYEMPPNAFIQYKNHLGKFPLIEMIHNCSWKLSKLNDL